GLFVAMPRKTWRTGALSQCRVTALRKDTRKRPFGCPMKTSLNSEQIGRRQHTVVQPHRLTEIANDVFRELARDLSRLAQLTLFETLDLGEVPCRLLCGFHDTPPLQGSRSPLKAPRWQWLERGTRTHDWEEVRHE